MPSPLATGHELGNATITLNQKMRRNTQISYLSKIRMGTEIEAGGKELLYTTCAKLPRRQADIVNNQQGYIDTLRSRVEMRRWAMLHPSQPTCKRVNFHERSDPKSESLILVGVGLTLQAEAKAGYLLRGRSKSHLWVPGNLQDLLLAVAPSLQYKGN